MNTSRFAQKGLILSLLVASAWAAPAKDTVRVEASRAFQLAIVDWEKRTPGRDSLHQAFAQSLSHELGERMKSEVPVKPVVADFDRLAASLQTGTQDAAIVIGASVPASIARLSVKVLTAMPDSRDPRRVFRLVIRTEDSSLAEMLEAIFPAVLNSPTFQAALAQTGSSVGKVASAN
jgi:hypothetical protein